MLQHSQHYVVSMGSVEPFPSMHATGEAVRANGPASDEVPYCEVPSSVAQGRHLL